MNSAEYERAMAEAQGDADTMLGAAAMRIRSLEREIAATRQERLDDDLRRKFHGLAVAMSPENLSRDGELSPARARAANARLLREWTELEALAGRRVTQDEVLAEGAGEGRSPASAPGHTPAPWFIQVTRASEDTLHHHVMAHAADDGRHVEVCRVFPISDDGQPGAESARNAALITAAPDMLHTLARIAEHAQKGIERNLGRTVNVLDTLGSLAVVKGLARAAVKRATNEEVKARCVDSYRLPLGRELRLESSGLWVVQPPLDNYWVEATTAQQALDKAGWMVSFESLAKGAEGRCEDEPSIAP
jgi:hypothetical protein